MSASDDSVDMTRTGSPVHHRKKHSMESSRSPRSSKHRHSRSRSRSRDRKPLKEDEPSDLASKMREPQYLGGDRKNRRSRSRSKEARKRDSEKPSKSQRKTDEQQEQERLSSDNGEERSRRKDRKPSKGRSLSRSHSRERRHHSKSKDKRRSRSRSRDRKKKARSRSGSRTKHRHHSRSRSKSRERKKRTEKVRRKSRSRSVNPPVLRGRDTAMDAQEALSRRLERAKKLMEQKEKEISEKQQQEPQDITAVAAPIAAAAVAASHPAINVAALLASGTQVTPQIAMAAQMAILQARTLAETGIAVPSYYNPSAVNPMKFAEQEKKRKKLWQGKKEGDKSQTTELWEKLNFGNKDQNVKFRKLMGIKDEDEAEVAKPLNEEGLKTLQKQEEMFRNLDVQYEMARSQTHTSRGMGLGFTSSFSRGMDSI